MSNGNASTALTTAGQGEKFLPVMTIEEARERHQAMRAYVNSLMHEGEDFGKIPGTDKNTLLKPGAEKLCTLFGLTKHFELVRSVEDWTGEAHGGEAFFYYLYRCTLKRGGQAIAEGDGSANSWESKYRWRWVQAQDVPESVDRARLRKRGGKISEFTFAVDKAETGGKYGKPAEHWQAFKDAVAKGTARKIRKKTGAGKELDAWEIESVVYRVPNQDVADVVNTVQKMASKRALVAATLMAVNASDYFTQDLEPEAPHGPDEGGYIDAEYEEAPSRQHPPRQEQPKPAPKQEPAAKPANQPKPPPKNWGEFVQRGRSMEADCVDKRLCGGGELFRAVAEYAHAHGLPEAETDWSEGQYADVWEYAKGLVRQWMARGPMPEPAAAG